MSDPCAHTVRKRPFRHQGEPRSLRRAQSAQRQFHLIEYVARGTPRRLVLGGRRSVAALVSRCVLVMCLTSLFFENVHGQGFAFGADRPRTIQSLSLAYKTVSFRFDGADTPMLSFEFDGPVYGAVYTRPSLILSFAYGPAAEPGERDLRLLDLSGTTWGEFQLTGSPASNVRLYVPIALHTDYRRVAPRGEEDSLVDAFNVTVLGLGSGLGYEMDLGGAARLHAWAMAIIGLAVRAVGDAAGSSRLIDTHVQMHTGQIGGRLGLSAGYAFRSQVWRVGTSSLFPQMQDDLFHYSGSQHVLMVGVNW